MFSCRFCFCFVSLATWLFWSFTSGLPSMRILLMWVIKHPWLISSAVFCYPLLCELTSHLPFLTGVFSRNLEWYVKWSMSVHVDLAILFSCSCFWFVCFLVMIWGKEKQIKLVWKCSNKKQLDAASLAFMLHVWGLCE